MDFEKITCKSHNLCNNAGSIKTCWYSDGSRCNSFDDTPNVSPSTECSGSLENKDTPRFGRNEDGDLYYETIEFINADKTRYYSKEYISEECGKRLLKELSVFL